MSNPTSGESNNQSTSSDLENQEVLETTGNGDESQPSDKGTSETGATSVEQLQENLKASNAELAKTQQMLFELQGRLMDRQERQEEETEEPETQEEESPLAKLSDEAISAMSNRDLLELSVKASTQAIQKTLRKELLPEINQRLGNLSSTVEVERAKRDVQTTAAKYPDFWNYQREMVKLSSDQKYKGLGAEDLYILAKSRTAPTQPQSGKIQQPTQQQRTSVRATSEKPGQTGAGGGPGNKGKNREMTPDEAGEDAWDKVFGKK